MLAALVCLALAVAPERPFTTPALPPGGVSPEPAPKPVTPERP